MSQIIDHFAINSPNLLISIFGNASNALFGQTLYIGGKSTSYIKASIRKVTAEVSLMLPNPQIC